MDANRQLITVKLGGTRYRGVYGLEGESLVVEGYGLGRKETDASLVDYRLGEPAKKLAKIVFTELVKESAGRGSEMLQLVTQGDTTQVALIESSA